MAGDGWRRRLLGNDAYFHRAASMFDLFWCTGLTHVHLAREEATPCIVCSCMCITALMFQHGHMSKRAWLQDLPLVQQSGSAVFVNYPMDFSVGGKLDECIKRLYIMGAPKVGVLRNSEGRCLTVTCLEGPYCLHHSFGPFAQHQTLH